MYCCTPASLQLSAQTLCPSFPSLLQGQSSASIFLSDSPRKRSHIPAREASLQKRTSQPSHGCTGTNTASLASLSSSRTFAPAYRRYGCRQTCQGRRQIIMTSYAFHISAPPPTFCIFFVSRRRISVPSPAFLTCSSRNPQIFTDVIFVTRGMQNPPWHLPIPGRTLFNPINRRYTYRRLPGHPVFPLY